MSRRVAPRRQRRLALAVLIGAAATAVLAFPVRTTWWGGWILAIAEAGLVGGLADWFAVTAIFRRPMGLPIPHTALIPANWELMAARVGSMVGDRVLTKQFVTDEVARLDLGEGVARAAARLTRDDLEAATRVVARWLVAQVPGHAMQDLLERVRQLLAGRAWAPTVATALELARERQWDDRMIGGTFRALAEALERPALSAALADLVDDLLRRYRANLNAYPRFWLSIADLLGVIDRRRILTSLRAGMREVADDPYHPLRQTLLTTVAEFAERLRTDPELAARVEAIAGEVLEGETLRGVLHDLADVLQRTVLADVEDQRSHLVEWVADRLERARRSLIDDASLRGELEAWVKQRVVEGIERHHGRIAGFIEKGVLALGPDGAVRLIEEHAGDDLQYIRVNGTVVGGLAGGAIYGIHMFLRLL
jgi:uncharacterized membrane-anchored protein YjiN (DUF445 family)